jgi:hypothetical protein
VAVRATAARNNTSKCVLDMIFGNYVLMIQNWRNGYHFIVVLAPSSAVYGVKVVPFSPHVVCEDA